MATEKQKAAFNAAIVAAADKDYVGFKSEIEKVVEPRLSRAVRASIDDKRSDGLGLTKGSERE